MVSAQPAPDRAGDDGEHDVVDRHAATGRVLDPLQVVQLAGGEGDLAIAADAAIERRVGAQRPELASQGRGESRQLTAALEPAARGGRRAGAARQRAADAAQPAARAGGEQARPAGGRLGMPLPQGERPVAVLGVPQELGEHPQAGDAVREAVVDADHERGAAIGERAGDAYRPERSGVIEALGHRLSDQPHQLGAVAHLIGSGAHVVADVEPRVVDPGRGGEPQRGRRQALAGAWQVPKPRLDSVAHTLDRQRLPVRRRLDDRQLQGVAGYRVGFEPQDAGVVGAQSLQAIEVCLNGAWAQPGLPAPRGLLDGDLALHAHLLVVVDRAVELVLPGLREIDGQGAALARRQVGLQLLFAVRALDLEAVGRLAVVGGVDVTLPAFTVGSDG